ncbi:MAG: hypothetical protein ACFFBP_03705 [Promethearchaeota archaeon]
MVQLALKQQVIDNGNFEKWNGNGGSTDMSIEIYIDKMLLNELEPYGRNVVVDVKNWKRFGKQQATLSLKIEN